MTVLNEQDRNQLENELEQVIGKHAFDAIEAAVLAKLAGMELPKPVMLMLPMTNTKELIELERWGRSANLRLRLLDQMDDGYWTPWHIATEAVTALQSKVESLSAEVERLTVALDADRAILAARTESMNRFMKERDQLEARGEAVKTELNKLIHEEVKQCSM